MDYHHPDLGGCFGPGCRVATGWDFVGDDFDANPANPTYNPVPAPDDDPDDCHGHGTHVAGIIGASGDPGAGGARGVAPGVTFGAYRVFGCNGSTTADIMLAAMERALADGMQVLNMSIGSAFQWPQYPTAMAGDRLVSRGMVVVASIGNNGSAGVYSAGAPGVGGQVIGVASFDNSHVALQTFTISPDGTSIGYGQAAAAPPAPTAGSWPVTRTGTAASGTDACDPLAPGSLAGQVALIRRGGCTFHQKSLNAQLAGAAGVVLYNNVAGRFSPTVAGTPAITIPVVAISDAEGVLMDSRLAAGPVDVTWTADTGQFANPTGGLISSFSSFGLAPDLSLKPDLGAPGGLIRSTYPLEQGGYATISGTSMSSPHVAGAAALLLEARPGTRAPDVRTLLQNSADPRPWWGNPALGYLDNVHRQGAGMADIDDAILATTLVEPGSLALGESASGPASVTLRIRNRGTSAVTYDLSHTPALSTAGSTYEPGYFTGFAGVTFRPASVTIGRGSTRTVHVAIAANPDLPDGGQYGGYIVLTPRDGGQVYRVPYAGFKGDYQSITALTPTAAGYPWLAVWTGLYDGAGNPIFANRPAGETFAMGDDASIPYLLVHLEHQVARLRLEVLDAATGAYRGRVLEMDYVGRSGATTGPGAYFVLAWDGGLHSSRTLPDGDYVLRLSVLKALGNPGVPHDWETWTSPTITIDGP